MNDLQAKEFAIARRPRLPKKIRVRWTEEGQQNLETYEGLMDRHDWTKKVRRQNEVLATIFAVAIWSLVAAGWWLKIQPM